MTPLTDADMAQLDAALKWWRDGQSEAVLAADPPEMMMIVTRAVEELRSLRAELAIARATTRTLAEQRDTAMRQRDAAEFTLRGVAKQRDQLRAALVAAQPYVAKECCQRLDCGSSYCEESRPIVELVAAALSGPGPAKDVPA